MIRVAIAILTLGVTLLLFAVPAAAVDSFFDVFSDLPTEGLSPFPSHDQGIGHMVGNGFHLDLVERRTLQQLGSGGALLGADIASFNVQPPVGVSNVSFFDVGYRPDLGGLAPWQEDSYVTMLFELNVPGGGPAQLVTLHPGVPDSFFDVFVGDSFFDITYRVEVGPGGGCDELHMHFECGPPLSPNDVQIGYAPNGESVFTLYFHLAAPFFHADPSLIFEVTTTGQFLEAPIATQQATWGKVKSLYRQ